MLKKFSIGLVIALFMALTLHTVALAAVLEVDTANSMFKTDNWQDTGAIVYSLDKALLAEPIGDEVRFACIIQANQADIQGEPVIINGSATNSIVLPFKQTSNVEKFSIKFINPTRSYFFSIYTSMDGTNWTEVDIAENAKKGSSSVTWDENGNLEGPAVNCYVSNPAGNSDDGDINLITFTLTAPAAANYFKITFYGNDNSTGDGSISHQWISFNSLSFEGSVATAAPVEKAPAAAAPEAAPVPAAVSAPTPTTAPSSAPATGASAVLAILSTLGAAVTFAKTRKSK